MKRSGKFYRKNEAEVMNLLGLEPTKNSGSGWVEKEDGQNDKVICQLKSTDKQSITLRKQDLDTLLYNASVSHKLPLFAVQFLTNNEVWLVVKPEHIQDLAEGIKTSFQRPQNASLLNFLEKDEDLYSSTEKVVCGASKARQAFHREIENKFNKEKKAK